MHWDLANFQGSPGHRAQIPFALYLSNVFPEAFVTFTPPHPCNFFRKGDGSAQDTFSKTSHHCPILSLWFFFISIFQFLGSLPNPSERGGLKVARWRGSMTRDNEVNSPRVSMRNSRSLRLPWEVWWEVKG